MCGRYSNHVKAMLDWSTLLGDWPEDIPESNNIAPGQTIAVFSTAGGAGMRWGLIPPWSKEVSAKYATFNARIETVASKPAFKHAWNQSQRCLVPALGYYEWRGVAGGKQPYFIHTPGSPLLMAGLYEPARGEGITASCTVLTQPAVAEIAHIHPRMPIMLPLDCTKQWFESDPESAMKLLTAVPDLDLEYYPVSKRVNNARNEAEDLIEPIELPGT